MVAAAGPARGGGHGWGPRAQAWAMAWPCGPVRVWHQRVRGWRAAASMRSRAVSASIGPQDPTSAGASDQPSSVPAGMVMLIRAGSGVLRPVRSNGDPGGGPLANPAGAHHLRPPRLPLPACAGLLLVVVREVGVVTVAAIPGRRGHGSQASPGSS